MPESNVRQAMLPAGARLVPNPTGTAPGSLTQVKGRWILTLPGIPRELPPMVEETVIPFLRQHFSLKAIVS